MSGGVMPDPVAVASDLQTRVEGEVLFDPLHRTLYSTAACIYQIVPLGAVVPRHEADVLAVLEYARRHGIPVTARGGGSGLAGETPRPRVIPHPPQHLKPGAHRQPGGPTLRGP